MKKIFLVVSAAMIALAVNAQEKGKISLEATIDPAALFDGGAGPLFQMPLIKGRYFLSESTALSFGLKVNNDADVSHPDDNDENKASSTQIGFAPAFEKHFPMGKVSPYVGAGVSVTMRSTKGTDVENDSIGGALFTTTTTYKNHAPGYGQAYFSFGVNGIVGADYYISDNLYVGMEFAVGYYSTKFKKTETTITSASGGTSISTTNTILEASTVSGFTLSSFSGLRIGVRF